MRKLKSFSASCYDRAKELLSQNRDVLDAIASYLREKETITGKQFMDIYNQVKGKADIYE